MTKLNSLYKNLASAQPVAQVDIQAFVNLGKGNYKFVAAIANVADEAVLAEAIASMTDGAARLVVGSTIVKDRIVAGVVTANSRSKPLDDSMTMVSACTASDSSGNIWNVVNDGSGKRVVLESADDLEDILKERIAGRKVVANSYEGAGVATASWSNGDVVRYFDADRGRVDCALAFEVDGGTTFVGVVDGSKIAGNMNAIISVAERSKLPKEVRAMQAECASAMLSPEDLEKVIAYLLKSGGVNEAMAAKYRTLAQTPSPAN
jgi:hypothetical protein